MAKPFPELLKTLSNDLQAISEPATVTIVELEYGYSYRGHVATDVGYEPIPSLDGTLWHPRLVEAKEAMDEDKRWHSELFLISRPRTQLGGVEVQFALGYNLR